MTDNKDPSPPAYSFDSAPAAAPPAGAGAAPAYTPPLLSGGPPLNDAKAPLPTSPTTTTPATNTYYLHPSVHYPFRHTPVHAATSPSSISISQAPTPTYTAKFHGTSGPSFGSSQPTLTVYRGALDATPGATQTAPIVASARIVSAILGRTVGEVKVFPNGSSGSGSGSGGSGVQSVKIEKAKGSSAGVLALAWAGKKLDCHVTTEQREALPLPGTVPISAAAPAPAEIGAPHASPSSLKSKLSAIKNTEYKAKFSCLSIALRTAAGEEWARYSDATPCNAPGTIELVYEHDVKGALEFVGAGREMGEAWTGLVVALVFLVCERERSGKGKDRSAIVFGGAGCGGGGGS